MKRTLRFALRAALVVAIVAALQMAAAPDRATPYASSLSILGASAALAAPGCNGKTCSKDPRKGPTCFKAVGSNCGVQSNGCFSNAC